MTRRKGESLEAYHERARVASRKRYSKERQTQYLRTKRATDPEWVARRRAYHRIWELANPENRRRSERKQRSNNPLLKLKTNLRRRLLRALKGEVVRSRSAVRDLGCSMDQFKSFLERKFEAEMTWDNYGKYWVLDHIVPLSAFDLTKDSDLAVALHFSNYQPLRKEENLEKSDKLDHVKCRFDLIDWEALPLAA